MKKYLLPLIFILLLIFTLTGNCTWLAGWHHRILLTVDQTKIDTTDLTWFPITVFLTATAGEEVFTEFDADADFDQVAFTETDGTTQLYAENELFDDSEQTAIYHVSLNGWIIDYDADTLFYLYYGNDHADNTDYIGTINTAVGGNVWDANFKAVYHMVDATTSTVKDSTSNNNDGAKKDVNTPVAVAGKVGQAQDFSGTDYIDIGAGASLDLTDGNFTLEAIYYSSVTNVAYDKMFGHYSEDNRLVDLHLDGAKHARLMYRNAAGTSNSILGTTNIEDSAYHYVVGVRIGNVGYIYVDTNAEKNNTVANIGDVVGTVQWVIGGVYNTRNNPSVYQNLIDATIDEIRISNTNRSVAWMKATYNSLWDTLLTYGSEEVLAVEGNAIMMGTNF
jgi:hypothetical protein